MSELGFVLRNLWRGSGWNSKFKFQVFELAPLPACEIVYPISHEL
jgi:hypothetical protein